MYIYSNIKSERSGFVRHYKGIGYARGVTSRLYLPGLVAVLLLLLLLLLLGLVDDLVVKVLPHLFLVHLARYKIPAAGATYVHGIKWRQHTVRRLHVLSARRNKIRKNFLLSTSDTYYYTANSQRPRAATNCDVQCASAFEPTKREKKESTIVTGEERGWDIVCAVTNRLQKWAKQV